VKLKELNLAAAAFIVEFSVGSKTPRDIEAQEFMVYLKNVETKKINRILSLYQISTKLEFLDKRAKESSAEVVSAKDGFVEMKDSSQTIVFKIKPTDVYLRYYLGVTDDYRYYSLLKFILSFSPYLELFAFSEGLDRLKKLAA
jgi:hypothetical protein